MCEFISWLKDHESSLIKAKAKVATERISGNKGVFLSPQATIQLERIRAS